MGCPVLLCPLSNCPLFFPRIQDALHVPILKLYGFWKIFCACIRPHYLIALKFNLKLNLNDEKYVVEVRHFAHSLFAFTFPIEINRWISIRWGSWVVVCGFRHVTCLHHAIRIFPFLLSSSYSQVAKSKRGALGGTTKNESPLQLPWV